MRTALLSLSLILLVSGFVLGFISRKYRTPNSPPIPSFNPIHWFQPWKINEWFTPKGVKLFMTSYTCIIAGIALYGLAEGFPSLFK
ncbi:hypothetical protein TRIP_C20927 [Candidatus Zixiibacteriota bacterium]|nr:hypothetical protein TRIP_C20927 [candidate division Zixibacteria bacterium]